MIKNDETKYPIEPAKQPTSAAAQIETALFTSIAEVRIVLTKSPFIPSSKVPASLSSIYTLRKLLPISEVTVVSTRSPVDIVTRIPIEKEKSQFQHVTTTFFQILKYLLVYHQFIYQGNNHQ